MRLPTAWVTGSKLPVVVFLSQEFAVELSGATGEAAKTQGDLFQVLKCIFYESWLYQFVFHIASMHIKRGLFGRSGNFVDLNVIVSHGLRQKKWSTLQLFKTNHLLPSIMDLWMTNLTVVHCPPCHHTKYEVYFKSYPVVRMKLGSSILSDSLNESNMFALLPTQNPPKPHKTPSHP